jgi:hypothetical protein
MSSNDPIFNQPSNRDRATEADAVRQGYGSAFDFLAVWNLIADYSRKERLIKEPILLTQLPAEAVWLGIKSSTLGIVVGMGLIALRFLVFGLCFYLVNLNRDIANLLYLTTIAALSISYFKTMSDYIRYPDGMTDRLIKINMSCIIGSVITIEIFKLIGIAAAFLCYPQIVSMLTDKPYSTELLSWFYAYFLNQPWQLILESCFIMQVIISGLGVVNKRRTTLSEKNDFDLAGV